jgi:hypothetical protein
MIKRVNRIVWVCFVLGYISVQSFSQHLNWAKNVGNEKMCQGSNVAVDNAGNVYNVGFFNDTVDFDPGPGIFNLVSPPSYAQAYILKLDSSGNFIWAKTFYGRVSDPFIEIDSQNNILLAGKYSSWVDFDPGPGQYTVSYYWPNDNFYLLKLDSSGSFIWVRTLVGNTNMGMNILYSFRCDLNDNYYLAGTFADTLNVAGATQLHTINDSGNSFVIKYDTNGNLKYAKSFFSNGENECFAIDIDLNLNLYATGYLSTVTTFEQGNSQSVINTNGNFGMYLCKFDSLGSFGWAKTSLNPAGNFTMNSDLKCMAGGGLIVNGELTGTVDFDFDSTSTHLLNDSSGFYFILKTDTGGNFIWAKQFGSTATIAWPTRSLGVDLTNNIYCSGEFHGTNDFDPGANIFNITSNGIHDFFVNILDSAGNFVNVLSLGGIGSDRIASNYIDHLNNLFITGYFAKTVDFDPGFLIYNLTSQDTGLSGSNIFVAKYSDNLSVGLTPAFSNHSNIVLFPNPATGIIQLTINTKHNAPLECEIINMMGGKVIKSQILNPKSQIDLDVSFLAKGIYLVRVGGGERWENKKLVVE